MKIELIPGRQLSASHYQHWQAILASRDDLDSGFFHPQLTRLTAEIRDDVEVAVMSDGEEPLGYFAFQRGAWGTAQGITGRLNEFQGIVSSRDAVFDPRALIRGCGLRVWHFDHLLVTQEPLSPWIWGTYGSPAMDLSAGYEHYRKAKRKQGKTVAQVERKARKLHREVGELRFEFHDTSATAMEALRGWKDAQHQRTGVLRIMQHDWVLKLLDAVWRTEVEGFAGVMSTLYAGDVLVAVHLGMTTPRALQIWFPAYDPSYERYSPGLVLMLELAKQAAERGITRIDFGRGEERYKHNLKTTDLMIAQGAVDRRLIVGPLHRQWFYTKRWIRNSPYRDWLESPLRATRRIRQWMAFR